MRELVFAGAGDGALFSKRLPGGHARSRVSDFARVPKVIKTGSFFS